MLSIIWSALQPFLVEIFKKGLDKNLNNNKWKRGTIGKFMALYNSMSDLEDVSRSILSEFSDIALNNAAITKTIISKRLDILRSKSEEFVKSAREVHDILSIYDDSLAILITGARETKYKSWCNVEVWLDALPSNLDDERRPTPIIRFSKILPTKQDMLHLGVQTSHPSMSQTALEQEARNIKSRILKKLKDEHGDVLDLRDKTALTAQIQSLSATIDNIASSRAALAKFIKDNYPISKILE